MGEIMGDLAIEKNRVQTGITPAQPASQAVDLQRNALQNEKGFSLPDSVRRLQKIAVGQLKERMRVEVEPGVFKYRMLPVHVPVSARVAAENSIESKMGWKAAEKIEVTQRSLFMNFNDLTSEDLKAIQGEPVQCVS